MSQKHWNSTRDQEKHSYVWQYGEELLELLSPESGEYILDLGCGTGQLTEKIAKAGANVIGIDSAPSMIEKAKQNYPDLDFVVADARNFQVEQPLEAVFSNAVLHWIWEPDAVIQSVYQALKVQGRFVAEFGGKGDIKTIVQALDSVLKTFGCLNSQLASTWWYFPSIGEYASRLEQQGFEVNYAVLFDRLTRLERGEAGISNWIQMFADHFLQEFSTEQQTQVIEAVEKQLQPTLYRDGIWMADYRRIRVVATKA